MFWRRKLIVQMANPRGQQRDKPFRDALRMELAAAGEDQRALRSIARRLIAKAEEGDLIAVKEIADRMDGKVPQALIGDDNEDPVSVRLETIQRIIVDPNSGNPDSSGVPPAT